MRWDGLRADREEARQTLPLFDDETVVRRIDTPEFRGITFYEVKAKSIINHVPGTRLGFNWTINPYRGCSHACVYCLDGETPILMADGRTKRLAEVTVGDEIIGSVRRGNYRRLVKTPVLAHWRSVKPAYRVTLSDGTELICSGDHRFLTDRGWKHVIGSEQRRARRPHLAVNDKLIGIGPFFSPPDQDAAYLGGYLDGVEQGPRRALSDLEAISRTRSYLADMDVGNQFLFQRASGQRREILPMPSSRSAPVTVIREATTWLSAISRKSLVEGQAIKSDSHRAVRHIEPLGLELPLYDITTGTGDFIANGVVSHNCFARPTHTYLDFNAGPDFSSKIVVKTNAVELLRRELRRPTWKGEHIAMGTNTDNYQRAEGRYRLMPGILSELNAARNPYSILTKSTLIQRDIDLLLEGASVTSVSACFSVGTVDEAVWKKTEPGTPHPLKRLEVVKKLNEAGVSCGVMIAPILPGISDSMEQLEATVKAAVQAGATHISPIVLHLRPGVKEEFMGWLNDAHPELVAAYGEIYGGPNASKQVADPIKSRVAGLKRRYGGSEAPGLRPPRKVSDETGAGGPAGGGSAGSRRSKARKKPAQEQLSLELDADGTYLAD